MNADEQKQIQEQRAKEIARGVNWLGAATILLFLAVVGIGIGGWLILHDEIKRNETARKGLCALRQDLDKRIEASQELLDKYPSGAIFGIPRSVIQQSVDNSKRTRRTLRVLDCKGGSQ